MTRPVPDCSPPRLSRLNKVLATIAVLVASSAIATVDSEAANAAESGTTCSTCVDAEIAGLPQHQILANCCMPGPTCARANQPHDFMEYPCAVNHWGSPCTT